MDVKLNTEQQELVTKNHRLIYWYAHKNNLNLEEWYDLLAIELCYTVLNYKEDKGSLSNYFKIRSDWMVSSKLRHNNTKKKQHIDVELFSDYGYEDTEPKRLFSDLELKELFEGEHGNIYQMIYEGYTQEEIASVIHKNQSYVSNLLKKMRKKNAHRQGDFKHY